MTIVSGKFFVLVLVTCAMYHALGRRWRNPFLLLVSYLFYASYAWYFPVILAAVTGCNYMIAPALIRGAQRAVKLGLGIGLNLAVLFFCKHFLPLFTIRHPGGKFFPIPNEIGISLLLPIGLAFYTLQGISYLLDVYRKQIAPCAKWVDFALYLSYFPKLIAGPVERAAVFLARLALPQVVDNSLLTRGFTLIVLGLVRKVVLADPLLRGIPADLFSAPATFSAPVLAAWWLAYIFGLYNDFAGYTDIVRGVSRLFGIELTANFAQPFFARSFSEFWSRWHISLAQWLRDTIYFPIDRYLLRRRIGNRRILTLFLPTMATMLASGLWHGPGWRYLVLFGLIGAFQIGERMLSTWLQSAPLNLQPRWRQWLGTCTVFTLLYGVGILFCMEMRPAIHFWQGLLHWQNLTLPDSHVFWLIPVSLIVDWLQARHRDEIVFLRWPRWLQAPLLALALLLIIIMSGAAPGRPFIYQGF